MLRRERPIAGEAKTPDPGRFGGAAMSTARESSLLTRSASCSQGEVGYRCCSIAPNGQITGLPGGAAAGFAPKAAEPLQGPVAGFVPAGNRLEAAPSPGQRLPLLEGLELVILTVWELPVFVGPWPDPISSPTQQPRGNRCGPVPFALRLQPQTSRCAKRCKCSISAARRGGWPTVANAPALIQVWASAGQPPLCWNRRQRAT